MKKQIEGYSYYITDSGEIFNDLGQRIKAQKHLGNRGVYYKVGLWKNNRRQHFRVHRLVAMAFIPNPDRKSEVHHIDGDTSNNCVNNLMWSTRIENEKFKKAS